MKVNVGIDKKLSDAVVDALMEAASRQVEASVALTTIAASVGAMIGESVGDLQEMRRLAQGIANGIKATAEDAYRDKLDRRPKNSGTPDSEDR